MTMQVDKARLDDFAVGRPKNGPTMQECIDMAKELLELRSLRSTEGKEGEPVFWQHHIWFPDTQKWSEWRDGSKPLYDNDFQTRALYATPEAAEAHVAKLEAALERIAQRDAKISSHQCQLVARAALTRSPE